MAVVGSVGAPGEHTRQHLPGKPAQSFDDRCKVLFIHKEHGPSCSAHPCCAGAQPRNGSSSIGAVGQLSTPELLAKRLQRQQAEREALAGLCSRPNLARRLLQPLQQPQQQHAHAPHQGSAAGPGSSAVNKLSRAAKRPLAAPKPSAMEPEQPTGVSADELAKVSIREGTANGPASH